MPAHTERHGAVAGPDAVCLQGAPPPLLGPRHQQRRTVRIVADRQVEHRGGTRRDRSRIMAQLARGQAVVVVAVGDRSRLAESGQLDQLRDGGRITRGDPCAQRDQLLQQVPAVRRTALMAAGVLGSLRTALRPAATSPAVPAAPPVSRPPWPQRHRRPRVVRRHAVPARPSQARPPRARTNVDPVNAPPLPTRCTDLATGPTSSSCHTSAPPASSGAAANRSAAVASPPSPEQHRAVEPLHVDQRPGQRTERFAHTRPGEQLGDLHRPLGPVEEPVPGTEHQRLLRCRHQPVEQRVAQIDPGGVAGVHRPPLGDRRCARRGEGRHRARRRRRRHRSRTSADVSGHPHEAAGSAPPRCAAAARSPRPRVDRRGRRRSDRSGGASCCCASAAATLPTAPDATRAMGRDSTAPTPPSTRTTVSSMSTDDTRPAPDRVSGRTTSCQRNRHRALVLHLDQHRRVVPDAAPGRRRAGPHTERALHDVATGHPHGGLHAGRSVEGTLTHRCLTRRLVPTVLGADPPVQAPARAAQLHPPRRVDIRDGRRVDRAERTGREHRRVASRTDCSHHRHRLVGGQRALEVRGVGIGRGGGHRRRGYDESRRAPNRSGSTDPGTRRSGSGPYGSARQGHGDEDAQYSREGCSTPPSWRRISPR